MRPKLCQFKLFLAEKLDAPVDQNSEGCYNWNHFLSGGVYISENLSGKAYVNEFNLTHQACQGDPEAWSVLVRQHQEAVFRLAYLLLGDADEASDVAQETFIRAFQALQSRFDPERPLRPWLLRITTNLVHNRRRAVGRYLAALGRFFWSGETEIVASSPGDEQAQQWEAQTLWQAVRR
jgi:RNA polymerase sigma-70 factor (ECF subfamily)